MSYEIAFWVIQVSFSSCVCSSFSFIAYIHGRVSGCFELVCGTLLILILVFWGVQPWKEHLHLDSRAY
jgi:hypothetical protein